MKTVATPISKYKNHNTNANNKKKKTNLEEDLLAGGTDVGRTRDHEDCGCPNLFWSFTKNRNHTNANNRRKVNLEDDLLAGGTEDCGFPRLDGYKIQKP